MSSAKEYIEEKLKGRGFLVVSSGAEYVFTIQVHGLRSEVGMCAGNVSAEVWKAVQVDGSIGFFYLVKHEGIAGRNDNLNNFVFRIIDTVFERNN